LEREPEERTYDYTITYTAPRTKIFWFSPTELKHLTIGALLVMGVALSYVIEALDLPMLSTPESLIGLAVIFTLSFLLHEITHKLSAQYFGLWAEFRVTLFGALITLFSIPFPFFKIISPGAVMIAGPITKREAGKTALAGPLTNMIISTICITVLANTESIFLHTISFFGAWINAIIALFNLVPFGIMDGLKVFRWNKLAWTAAFMTAIAMTILTYSML